MKVNEFIKIFEERFPKETAIIDDPVGLHIGNYNNEITGIVFALELNQDVIDYALNNKANFIFTHHPFIYFPFKRILENDIKGNYVYQLIKNDITLYAAHTNLDIGNNGVNDALCELLEINNIIKITDKDNYEFMRMGEVKKQSMYEYLKFIKSKLNTENIRFIGDINKEVSKVAIVGGAGQYDFKDAYKNNCDLYLTGDITHHIAQDIYELGFNACDISHNAEKYYIPKLIEVLKPVLKDIKLYQFLNEDYYKII